MNSEPRNLEPFYARSVLGADSAIEPSGEGARSDEELVELYAAGTSLEADRLVMLLADNGIEGLAHATTVPSFPSAAEQHFLVVVPAHAQERSRAIIEEAIRDGVLSQSGAELR